MLKLAAVSIGSRTTDSGRHATNSGQGQQLNSLKGTNPICSKQTKKKVQSSDFAFEVQQEHQVSTAMEPFEN